MEKQFKFDRASHLFEDECVKLCLSITVAAGVREPMDRKTAQEHIMIEQKAEQKFKR